MNKGKYIIIGDVHGCIDELKQLISILDPSKEDKLFFIGDLIDKGPDSPAVIKFVKELAVKFTVNLVLGNHEEKFLRYWKHVKNGKGAEKNMKNTDEYPKLHSELDEEDIIFLESAYYSIPLPEIGLTLLHGGVSNNLHFPFPFKYSYLEHNAKKYKGLDLITKTRYLNPEGKFVGLGEEKESDKFWAETYNGAYGKIIFGHQPFLQEQPKIFPNAIGIDTACVFGGWLTAMVVEGHNVEFKQVKSLMVYSNFLKLN
jgi:serine/threonine protein phosphatase 1